ncbi:MAG: ABC transporter permease, partial [Anaerolineales bacterium]|nr:ABC transporter permease [Anaerolineales bacterium]
MDTNLILIGLAGVLASAAPVVFATVGETLAERSGVINLSVNGTILLSAMGSFAVSVTTGSLLLGFLAGMLIGALVALVVAFTSISLKQSQVAVGFVLALMCRDLAYFLGNPYMGRSGPRVPALPIPGLSEIPILGPLFFRQNLLVYLSFALIVLAWVWIYRTRPGLTLRGVGERPAAAFVRGGSVNRLRYLYTVLGGALVGLAGPTYSLSVKAGWMGTISGLDGLGW